MPAIDIDFDDQHAALVRSDGRIYVQGQDALNTCRPPAGVFVDVEMGYHFALGLRPDGTIEGWGDFLSNIGPIPVLPAGVTYVGMAAGGYHAILLRSDGQVEAIGFNWYGELNVPQLPAGVTFVKVKSQWYHTVALLSDGSVVAWGDATYGQANVPPAPAGTYYTDVSCGYSHCLAMRSDGEVVAWGNNFYGELSVPALPAGLRYELCAAGGGYSIAWRSDGMLVGWGRNGVGQTDVPDAPPGLSCVQIEAGNASAFARWSDGSVSGWGADSYNAYGVPNPNPLPSQTVGQARFVDAAVGYYHSLVLRADGSVEGFGGFGPTMLTAPPLPQGVTYTKLGADLNYSLALRSDGVLVLWDSSGISTTLSLPPGLGYVGFSAASSHVLALRSDGEVEAFGRGSSGQLALNVPPLPPGLSYVQVDAHYLCSLFRRSDGAVLFAGSPAYWVAWIPASPPAGLQYTEIACGQFLGAGLLSDGTGEVWYPNVQPPVLPWGVYYVQVDCGDGICWFRRSDGDVVVVGQPPFQQYSTPALDPGTSYLSIDAGDQTVIARVGPTCTYVGVHPGCAGTRPATRLVPRDTPRIGSRFEVRLFDLPHDIAVMGMGFQEIAPVDLASLGLPGCELAIALDSVVGLFGQANQAVWTLPIPDSPSLVGVLFYNQALVLDINAGNPFGAVVSDAMEGVVGYP